jgi:hypothetical protein
MVINLKKIELYELPSKFKTLESKCYDLLTIQIHLTQQINETYNENIVEEKIILIEKTRQN